MLSYQQDYQPKLEIAAKSCLNFPQTTINERKIVINNEDSGVKSKIKDSKSETVAITAAADDDDKTQLYPLKKVVNALRNFNKIVSYNSFASID